MEGRNQGIRGEIKGRQAKEENERIKGRTKGCR